MIIYYQYETAYIMNLILSHLEIPILFAKLNGKIASSAYIDSSYL